MGFKNESISMIISKFIENQRLLYENGSHKISSNSVKSRTVFNNVLNLLKNYDTSSSNNSTLKKKFYNSFVIRIELSITDTGHKPLLNNKILGLTKSVISQLRQCLRRFNLSVSNKNNLYLISSSVHSSISRRFFSAKQSVLSSPHVDKIGQTTYVKDFNKSKIIITIPVYYFSLQSKEFTFNFIKKYFVEVLDCCNSASSKTRISGEFFLCE